MKVRTHWSAVALAAVLMATGVSIAAAQNPDKPVGNLRLAVDGTGKAMPPISEPPEKVYKLPAGTTELIVAYDYQGSSPTNVSIRVLGPTGTIEFQQQEVVSAPGTHVVTFKKDDGSIADNEYIVNAYVGDQQYLADSLQLAVGEAVIQTGTSVSATPQATSVGGDILPTAPSSPTTTTPRVPGTGPGLLILAGVLLLVLGGVVVWAVRSAMAGGKS